MRKTSIGKFYSFKFPGRESTVTGIVLDHSEEWILIRKFVDYRSDGYMIFKNEDVQEEHGAFERFATRILKLKNQDFFKKPKVPIHSLDEMLSFLDKKYDLIQLDTVDGEASDVVKYKWMKNGLYYFDELTARAKWRYELKLTDKEIRFIGFDNDYLKSLRLVTKFKQETKSKSSRQRFSS